MAENISQKKPRRKPRKVPKKVPKKVVPRKEEIPEEVKEVLTDKEAKKLFRGRGSKITLGKDRPKLDISEIFKPIDKAIATEIPDEEIREILARISKRDRKLPEVKVEITAEKTPEEKKPFLFGIPKGVEKLLRGVLKEAGITERLPEALRTQKGFARAVSKIPTKDILNLLTQAAAITYFPEEYREGVAMRRAEAEKIPIPEEISRVTGIPEGQRVTIDQLVDIMKVIEKPKEKEMLYPITVRDKDGKTYEVMAKAEDILKYTKEGKTVGMTARDVRSAGGYVDKSIPDDAEVQVPLGLATAIASTVREKARAERDEITLTEDLKLGDHIVLRAGTHSRDDVNKANMKIVEMKWRSQEKAINRVSVPPKDRKISEYSKTIVGVERDKLKRDLKALGEEKAELTTKKLFSENSLHTFIEGSKEYNQVKTELDKINARIREVENKENKLIANFGTMVRREYGEEPRARERKYREEPKRRKVSDKIYNDVKLDILEVRKQTGKLPDRARIRGAIKRQYNLTDEQVTEIYKRLIQEGVYK